MKLTNQEKLWIKEMREVMAANAKGVKAFSLMAKPKNFVFLVYCYNRHGELTDIGVQPRNGKLFTFDVDDIEVSEHNSHNLLIQSWEYWGYETSFIENF